MPRAVDGTFRRLLGEIDPRKVATVVDEYGPAQARERWHWCLGHIDALAAEGRRMKAAGEKWVRVSAPEPEEPPLEPAALKPYQPRLADGRSARPAPKPAAPVAAPAPDLVPALRARVRELEATVADLRACLAAAAAPRPAPRPSPPPAPPAGPPGWAFPIAPGLLLRKSRTTTIPTLAMMLGVSGREVRDAIELARSAA